MVKTIRYDPEEPEHARLLSLLASVFEDFELNAEAKAIEKLKGEDPEFIRKALSAIEQQPGLPTNAWKFIVRYKAWLDGKLERDEFFIDCMKSMGLM